MPVDPRALTSSGRHLALRRRLSVAAALLLGSLGAAPAAAAAPNAAPPSGIGDQSVFWIAVSPAYARTGLVLAVTTPQGPSCSGSCTELWVSHDGGASWAQSSAMAWEQGRPVVVLDGPGREVLFAASGRGLQRSDDEGASWHDVAGPGVLPAPDPAFASTGQVAVASGGGTSDYLLRGASSEPVTGSGGSLTDLQFALAPTFPAGGRHAPALLSAASSANNNEPIIQRCTAALSCAGSTTLAGATNFSAPVTLAMAGDYASSGTVFAQSGRGLYKSIDGGTSFVPLPVFNGQNAATTATPSLALQPGYREGGPVRTLFASLFSVNPDINNPRSGGGVYRSDDGGATWRDAGSPSPLDMGSTAVAVAPDGRIFAGYLGSSNAGTYAGLLCSSNGGGTWRATCPAVGGSAHGGGTTAGGGNRSSQAGASANSSARPCTATAASCPPTAGRSNGGQAGNGAATGTGGALGASPGASGGAGRIAVPVAIVAVLIAAIGGVTLALLRRRRGADA